MIAQTLTGIQRRSDSRLSAASSEAAAVGLARAGVLSTALRLLLGGWPTADGSANAAAISSNAYDISVNATDIGLIDSRVADIEADYISDIDFEALPKGKN